MRALRHRGRMTPRVGPLPHRARRTAGPRRCLRPKPAPSHQRAQTVVIVLVRSANQERIDDPKIVTTPMSSTATRATSRPYSVTAIAESSLAKRRRTELMRRIGEVGGKGWRGRAAGVPHRAATRDDRGSLQWSKVLTCANWLGTARSDEEPVGCACGSGRNADVTRFLARLGVHSRRRLTTPSRGAAV